MKREEMIQELKNIDCTLYDVDGNPILLPDGGKREITNRRLAVDYCISILEDAADSFVESTLRYVLICRLEAINQDNSSLVRFVDSRIGFLSSGNRFSCIEAGEYDLYFPINENMDYVLDNNGICKDCGGVYANIRLLRTADDKIIMKRIGKYIANSWFSVVERNQIREKFVNRYCEIATTIWECHHREHSVDNLELVVSDDFDEIYDSSNYRDCETFHSCMQGKSCVEFYNDINCDCKAVSLRDADGAILARSIIFNDVFDSKNNKYRLLERIYGLNDTYREILFSKVCEQNLADCHKALNASCSDCRNIEGIGDFADVDFTKKDLRIDCDGMDYDRVPYMDTFKYLRKSTMLASNSARCYDYELTETCGYIRTTCCDYCGHAIPGEDYGRYCDLNDCTYCDDCAVWSDWHDTYISREDSVEFYNSSGYVDYYHPHYSTPDCVDVCGDMYEIGNKSIVYDEINDEYILVADSVKYYDEDLCVGYTHKEEIDNTIFKIDGEYYIEDLVVLDEINDEYILVADSVNLVKGSRVIETSKTEDMILSKCGLYYTIETVLQLCEADSNFADKF